MLKTYDTQNWSPHVHVVVVAGFNDLHSQGVALLAAIINSSNTHNQIWAIKNWNNLVNRDNEWIRLRENFKEKEHILALGWVGTATVFAVRRHVCRLLTNKRNELIQTLGKLQHTEYALLLLWFLRRRAAFPGIYRWLEPRGMVHRPAAAIRIQRTMKGPRRMVESLRSGTGIQ